MSNVTNIQTPGETQTIDPADNPETGADPVKPALTMVHKGAGKYEVVNAAGEVVASKLSKDEAKAMVDCGSVVAGETQTAEQVETETEEKTFDRPSRAHYATMRAHQIDPSTLSKAVLSKDGWVVTHKPESKV